MELLEGERVLAFDLETTGISTSRDRIVQLALIGSDADGSELSYDRLVNPRRPIPYEAQRVHGISDSDVRGEPDFSTIADQVAALIQGSVLVGHNVRKFDMPMLRNEFLRIGALPPEPKAILDTLEMVRRLKLPRPHRLGSQCARHGISLENAHTAAADAAASLLLLWKLGLDHPTHFRKSLLEVEQWCATGSTASPQSDLGRQLDDLELVDSNGMVRRDGEHMVLAVGRHRGRHLKELLELDISYLHWLSSPNGIEDQGASEEIKTYLGLGSSS